MTLTTAGRLFHARAKQIEQEYLQAREEIMNLTDVGLDVLRVGAGPLFHLRYLPAVFDRLHREYPYVKLELHSDTNERTIPLLLSGELDIVLGVLDLSVTENCIAIHCHNHSRTGRHIATGFRSAPCRLFKQPGIAEIVVDSPMAKILPTSNG